MNRRKPLTLMSIIKIDDLTSKVIIKKSFMMPIVEINTEGVYSKLL